MSEVRDTIHEKDEHTVASFGSTMTTFAVLAVLAVLQLSVGFTDFGPMKILASLTITGVQVFVLSVFFMDLRQADKLTWLCAGASVFWVLIMFTFTLTDFITRHMAAY